MSTSATPDTRTDQEVIRDAIWGLDGHKPSDHLCDQLVIILKVRWLGWRDTGRGTVEPPRAQ